MSNQSQVSQATIKAIGGFVAAQGQMTNVIGTLRACVQNDLIRLGLTMDNIAEGLAMPAKPQHKQGEYVGAFAGEVAKVYTARCSVPMVAHFSQKGKWNIRPETMPKKGEEGYDEALAQMRTATACLTRVFTFAKPEDNRSIADKAAAFVKRIDAALEKMPAAERRLVKAKLAELI